MTVWKIRLRLVRILLNETYEDVSRRATFNDAAVIAHVSDALEHVDQAIHSMRRAS